MIAVSIVGGSGYVGGELLRLLLAHPQLTVAQVTSDRLRGRRVQTAHPNLRDQTDLRFSTLEDLESVDVVFLAMPSGESSRSLAAIESRTKQIVDLSSDFRLRDENAYERYYNAPHFSPTLSSSFVPGYPELFRSELRDADRIAVPGCTATAATLALLPLVQGELIEPDVCIDARSGSSGSGGHARSDAGANVHAERASALRVFAPAGHRHEAEVSQQTGLTVRMTATGVQAVRGAQVVCHTVAREPVDARVLQHAYRVRYADEPFVRLVADRSGRHRLPDPSTLLGSNFCDVGFGIGSDGLRLTAIAALDNLVKGGAGNAVQCLNIRMGWCETAGLEFSGLYPV